MKRWMLALLCVAVCLTAIPAQAQVMTVGGAAVGKTFQGPDASASYGTAFLGMRVKKIGKTANVFGALQGAQIDHPAINAWGGDLILQNDIYKSRFSLLLDIGWLTKIAVNGDGSRTTGVALGGGMAWQAGDILGLFVYGKAYDAGPAWDYTAYAGIFGLNLHRLVPGAS